MAETKRKGDLGEAMVIAEAMKRGYKVAIPIGEDWRYDLILQKDGKLYRIQCKYTESDGEKISVRCRSTNNWRTIKYTSEDFDFIANYDKTTDTVYFIPSEMLGKGKNAISLRIKPPKGKNQWKLRWAKDFKDW